MKGIVNLMVILALCVGLTAGVSCDPKTPDKGGEDRTPSMRGADDKAPAKDGEDAEKKDDEESSAADPAVEKAIKTAGEAVAWFKKVIAEDGTIEVDMGPKGKFKHVGMTALAFSALAGAPEELQPEVKDLLPKMAEYLVKSQNEDGSVYNKGEEGSANYQTAVAAVALMKYDAEKYEKAIDKAVEYLLSIQVVDEKDVAYGGWGYKDPKKKSTPKYKRLNADLSNTHFTLEALKKSGIDENHPAFKRAMKFLERSQNRSESNDAPKLDPTLKVGDDGGFLYGPGASRSGKVVETPEGKLQFDSYASMTYAGLKSMIYANAKKDDPRVQAAFDWIKKHYTLDENWGMGTREKKGSAQQGLFYFYHVFAKALKAYGQRYITTQPDGVKHDWPAELVDKLAEIQQEDGSWKNTWNDRWFENNPILVTAYALDALNVAVDVMR